ncbi:MAG: hypothetical protein N2249_08625 [Melioribacter sp.]|nr:hypothetical protein [Melioribacter sp.]
MKKTKVKGKFSMIFPLFFYSIKTDLLFNKINFLKILLIITIIFITSTACEEIPNNVIEQKLVNENVEIIEAPDKFYYSNSDSTFITSIKLVNKNQIESVWINVIFYDGSLTAHQKIFMSDKGDFYFTGDKVKDDNIFSAKVSMSKKFPSGKYTIEYYVQKKISSSFVLLKYATHSFDYFNSQVNFPPLITEVIVPSFATYGQRITLMIKVNDANGLNDISSVYYELYKPDGTKAENSQGISQFPLFDDGNKTSNGDETANDGIYSVYLTFPYGQPSGEWRFEFYAKDKGGLISEKAVHYLTLK